MIFILFLQFLISNFYHLHLHLLLEWLVSNFYRLHLHPPLSNFYQVY